MPSGPAGFWSSPSFGGRSTLVDCGPCATAGVASAAAVAAPAAAPPFAADFCLRNASNCSERARQCRGIRAGGPCSGWGAQRQTSEQSMAGRGARSAIAAHLPPPSLGKLLLGLRDHCRSSNTALHAYVLLLSGIGRWVHGRMLNLAFECRCLLRLPLQNIHYRDQISLLKSDKLLDVLPRLTPTRPRAAGMPWRP